MRRPNKVRSSCRTGAPALLVCLLSFAMIPSLALAAVQDQSQAPAPIERRPPPASYPSGQEEPAQGARSSYAIVRSQPERSRGAASSLPRGEHLAQWMSLHSNLTPQQQQQALGQEPGFSRLPTDTQQRMRERLSQLDAMPPTQRQRILERTEAMERLAPEQRAEVRGAMSQLGALPIDQRRVVARTFRALRDVPPDQRGAALASGRYGPSLDSAQQAVLQGLLRVEPMLPPPSRQGTPNSITPGGAAPTMQPGQPGYPPR